MECGQEMTPTVIRKGGSYKSKVTRYECVCGFQTAGESTTERMENDRLDQEVKEKTKKKREPFVDPDEETWSRNPED